MASPLFARSIPVLALAGALALLGCGGGGDEGGGNPGPVIGQQAPDFSLQDVNENSPTATTMISPRDHLGRISAWYFGHAT